MEHASRATALPRASLPSASYTGPLVIITILFFMWGALTALNDILIPHLKAVYDLTYVQAMLVQFCFFGAYGLVSLPAGILIRKIGYQHGVVTGLVVAAIGCALFYPASTGGYALFLLALFIMAAGITTLQVAANPFVTALGDPATASSRLTLTQAFNALGTTIAPWLGGLLILSGTVPSPAPVVAQSAPAQLAYRAAEAALVRGPYLALAAALLALAVLCALARLPKISHGDAAAPPAGGSVLAHRHLVLGAIAIFLYVGGEVSIGSFMISFLGESNIGNLAAGDASRYVALYWGGAMVGRFIGFAVMRYVSPGKTLAFNAVCVIALTLLAVFSEGSVAMWAIIGVGLFNSIMFPTIFSMAMHGLGAQTGQASGILCMAIVGGAFVPFLQGAMADMMGLQLSFLVPAACYCFILYFGLRFARLFSGVPAAGGH